jgi:hypothetical protein
MGPYAGADYNSPYFIVNSVVRYPPPLQREKGGVGKISLVEHIFIRLLISKTTNRKRNSTEKGEGVGES